jgi:hypothetical protein
VLGKCTAGARLRLGLDCPVSSQYDFTVSSQSGRMVSSQSGAFIL